MFLTSKVIYVTSRTRPTKLKLVIFYKETVIFNYQHKKRLEIEKTHVSFSVQTINLTHNTPIYTNFEYFVELNPPLPPANSSVHFLSPFPPDNNLPLVLSVFPLFPPPLRRLYRIMEANCNIASCSPSPYRPEVGCMCQSTQLSNESSSNFCASLHVQL